MTADRPASHALLIRCAAGTPDGGGSEPFGAIVDRVADWDEAIALATTHRVLPLVDARLCAGDCRVPLTVHRALGAASRTNAEWSLRLAGALVRMSDALAARGIAAIAWKGPALSLAVYGHLARRMPSDLDLLVRRSEVRKAAETLVALGYCLDHRHDDLRVWSFSGAGGLVVELHWAPMPWANVSGLRTQDLQVEMMPMGDTLIRHLSPADLLVTLCAHGTKHRWARLLWIADIAHLLGRRRDLDWDRAGWLAARTGLSRAVGLGLTLLDVLWATPTPSAAAALLRHDRQLEPMARGLAARVFEQPPGPPRGLARVADFAFRLRAMERRRDRVRYAVGVPAGRVWRAWAERWSW